MLSTTDNTLSVRYGPFGTVVTDVPGPGEYLGKNLTEAKRRAASMGYVYLSVRGKGVQRPSYRLVATPIGYRRK